MYPVRRMFGFGRIKGEERERERKANEINRMADFAWHTQ